MKTRIELFILFSVLIVISVGLISLFSFQYVEESVKTAEFEKMRMTLHDKEITISTLHSRASEDIVFALQNPLFVDYFELPETKAGNIYIDGVLQFTENQIEIKTKLEQWIYHFQNKFQVDETCLIDKTGQEHARLVLQRIAPDQELSPEEKSAPFFEPSFEKQKDQVHIQYPYLSPDTNRWVFAYTSPVVLSDGVTEAIYHFEMPISIFQDLLRPEQGRMYVLDQEGFLIADSGNYFPGTNISPELSKYYPPVDSISSSQEFHNLIQDAFAESEGSGVYLKNNEPTFLVYKKLPTFGWLLVYEKPQSLMGIGDNTLDDFRINTILLDVIISVVAIATVFFASSKISNRNHQKPSEEKIV